MKLLSRCGQWFRRLDAPVLVQEMRVRQRGIKPFIIILAYLLILCVAAMLMLYYDYPQRMTASSMSELGKQLYALLSFFQLAMICLIVPAYSSGSVSGERERGTFDLLALTVLSSSSIVTQKLVAAIGQALMLIIASLPIMGIVFLLGGVSPTEIAVSYSILLVTAVLLGALGMLCSCCLRSSKGSTFLTYLVMFCSFAGVPICLAWFESMSHSYSYQSFDMPSVVLFCIGFLFVGAVGSVLVYATVALIMHNRPLWRLRAFRMSVFGGVYAILLFMVTCPAVTDVVFGKANPSDIPLLLYVNPFAALFCFMDSHFSSGPTSTATAYWMLGATFGFSIGCAIVFRFVSSARLAGLRSS